MSDQTLSPRQLKPLTLGAVTVDPPLVLAPLAGHTDRAFRRLVKGLGGCGLVVTEMVSSEGLTRGSEHSLDIAAVTGDERRRSGFRSLGAIRSAWRAPRRWPRS